MSNALTISIDGEGCWTEVSLGNIATTEAAGMLFMQAQLSAALKAADANAGCWTNRPVLLMPTLSLPVFSRPVLLLPGFWLPELKLPALLLPTLPSPELLLPTLRSPLFWFPTLDWPAVTSNLSSGIVSKLQRTKTCINLRAVSADSSKTYFYDL